MANKGCAAAQLFYAEKMLKTVDISPKSDYNAIRSPKSDFF